MAGRRASRGRMRALLLALPACVAAPDRAAAEPAAPAPPAAACTGAAIEGAAGPVAVTGVEDRLVLRLADDRRLRLVGVDPAEATPDEPGRAEDARAALARLVGDRPVRFALLDAKPDRWGRRAALAFADGPPSPDPQSLGSPNPEPPDLDLQSLSEAALAAGLGRYLAEPMAHPCRERLLAAERRARAARAGLWSDPYYAVLAATDRPAFAERSATVAIAEGRLTQIVPGPYRTELRFAAPGRRDLLAVAIPPRVAKAFKDQGVDLSSLIGRTVRVRGLLDLRFGPRLEPSGPDALEMLPDADRAR